MASGMNKVILTERNTFMGVIETFIRTIEAAGGVVEGPIGLHEPVGDRSWIDLGEAYVEACRAIGRKPRTVEDDDED